MRHTWAQKPLPRTHYALCVLNQSAAHNKLLLTLRDLE